MRPAARDAELRKLRSEVIALRSQSAQARHVQIQNAALTQEVATLRRRNAQLEAQVSAMLYEINAHDARLTHDRRVRGELQLLLAAAVPSARLHTGKRSGHADADAHGRRDPRHRAGCSVRCSASSAGAAAKRPLRGTTPPPAADASPPGFHSHVERIRRSPSTGSTASCGGTLVARDKTPSRAESSAVPRRTSPATQPRRAPMCCSPHSPKLKHSGGYPGFREAERSLVATTKNAQSTDRSQATHIDPQTLLFF